jgi:hypothetical protein
MGELQRTLVRGTAGEHSDAGGLRDRQVFIGPPEAPIESARLVPAPHGDQLTAAFEAWITRINRKDIGLPPVVQAGLSHYQFEALHPYSDSMAGSALASVLLAAEALAVASVDRRPAARRVHESRPRWDRVVWSPSKRLWLAYGAGRLARCETPRAGRQPFGD